MDGKSNGCLQALVNGTRVAPEAPKASSEEAPKGLSEEKIGKAADMICSKRREDFDVNERLVGLFGKSEVSSVPEAAADFFQRFGNIAPKDQAKIIARAEAVAKQDDERFQAARTARRMEKLLEALGKRHATNTVANFTAATDAQAKVKAAVVRYVEKIGQNVRDGHGMILFGPVGSGKTHFASAIAKAAVNAGLSVAWRTGPEIFAGARALIGDKSTKSEERFIESFIWPDVLFIDDLAPAAGCLTDYQTTTLFSIVDGRYRDAKPTIVTLNVASGEEAAGKIGAPTQDRLRDGAICLYCNWPSYRRPEGTT